MQRVKIEQIAKAFKCSPAAVIAALKIRGKPVFGGYVFLDGDLVDMALYEEMNLAQQMHLAQTQRRHETLSPR